MTITSEQRLAIETAGDEPVKLEDPLSGQVYVVLKAEVYERVREILRLRGEQAWAKLTASLSFVNLNCDQLRRVRRCISLLMQLRDQIEREGGSAARSSFRSRLAEERRIHGFLGRSANARQGTRSCAHESQAKSEPTIHADPPVSRGTPPENQQNRRSISLRCLAVVPCRLQAFQGWDDQGVERLLCPLSPSSRASGVPVACGFESGQRSQASVVSSINRAVPTMKIMLACCEAIKRALNPLAVSSRQMALLSTASAEGKDSNLMPGGHSLAKGPATRIRLPSVRMIVEQILNDHCVRSDRPGNRPRSPGCKPGVFPLNEPPISIQSRSARVELGPPLYKRHASRKPRPNKLSVVRRNRPRSLVERSRSRWTTGRLSASSTGGSRTHRHQILDLAAMPAAYRAIELNTELRVWESNHIAPSV